eukprot:scaffold69368_cov63-Phaeocystis_antarctica.AAC.2
MVPKHRHHVAAQLVLLDVVEPRVLLKGGHRRHAPKRRPRAVDYGAGCDVLRPAGEPVFKLAVRLLRVDGTAELRDQPRVVGANAREHVGRAPEVRPVAPVTRLVLQREQPCRDRVPPSAHPRRALVGQRRAAGVGRLLEHKLESLERETPTLGLGHGAAALAIAAHAQGGSGGCGGGCGGGGGGGDDAPAAASTGQATG